MGILDRIHDKTGVGAFNCRVVKDLRAHDFIVAFNVRRDDGKQIVITARRGKTFKHIC